MLGVHPVVVAPHLGGDEMRVHGERDGRRRVVPAELPQHVAHLAVRGTAATELDRHQGAREADGPERVERGDRQLAAAVVLGDLGPKADADVASDPGEGGGVVRSVFGVGVFGVGAVVMLIRLKLEPVAAAG